LRKLIYSMSVSLDGYIAGPGGNIDWSGPDEELHRFHNQEVRELSMHLLGRGLYETMVYWETADRDPSMPEYQREFAGIWQELPKLVYSTTLEEVEGNSKLVREVVPDQIAELKAEPGKDIAVGGAGLASTFMKLGLIDEYRLFVNPVVLGAGTPYFPALKERIGLELVETRAFDSPAVYLRYRLSEPR
jgi:dihydrofolate reductase